MNTMKSKLHPEDFKPLFDQIELVYQGNLRSLNQDLHKLVELLHYVDANEIQKEEIKEGCFVIQILTNAFVEIEQERRSRNDKINVNS